jgi:hypothetical protein
VVFRSGAERKVEFVPELNRVEKPAFPCPCSFEEPVSSLSTDGLERGYAPENML